LVGVFLRFDAKEARVVGVIFVLLLGAITSIEVRTGLIPDAVTIPGIGISLALSFLGYGASISAALAGIVVGGGAVLFVILLSRGGVGGGVMKMAAMAGGFLGWKLIAVALMATFMIGGAVAWLMTIRGVGTRTALELGPFLALAGMAAFLWGTELLTWYAQQ
jgi:leader peptidase (prepilin peptidase)/N-methyltransferase